MAFSIGDRVRCIQTNGGDVNIGEEGTMMDISGDDYYRVDFPRHTGWAAGKEHIELINKFKKMSCNIVEKIKLALKSEPEKSFIKSGIMDENENLTDDGRKVLEMILVEANKEALKEKADIILAEEKEEEKK